MADGTTKEGGNYGEVSDEEERRPVAEEVERLKREGLGESLAADEIGKHWPEQIQCSCGGKARLTGPRFATVAEYRCGSCGEITTRMIYGSAG